MMGNRESTKQQGSNGATKTGGQQGNTNALMKAPIGEHEGCHEVELTKLIMNPNSRKLQVQTGKEHGIELKVRKI